MSRTIVLRSWIVFCGVALFAASAVAQEAELLNRPVYADPDALFSPVSVEMPTFAVGTTINFVDHAIVDPPDPVLLGPAILGITVGPNPDGEESVLVLNQNTGEAHYYTLDLVFDQTIDVPDFAAGETYTGVAYNPDTETYFWLQSAPTPQLIESEADGTLIGLAMDVVPPSSGGGVGGMTYNDVTETFWAVDIANDEFFEFDETGEITDVVFRSPDWADVGAFGNGIAHISGTDCFQVLSGRVFEDPFTSRLRRVDMNGAEAGASTELVLLDAALAVETFINGVAYSATRNSVYITGDATDHIFEVGLNDDCDPCPITGLSNFECDQDAGTVTLSYTNPEDYEDIEVWVDGDFFEDVLFPLDGLHELTLTAGAHDIFLRFSDGADSCDTSTCQLMILGEGAEAGQFIAESPAGAALLGIAVCDENDSIYCPDLFSGDTYVFDKDLTLTATIDSPTPATGTVGVWIGVAWGNPDAAEELYWMIQLTTGVQNLIVTDLDGVVIDDFVIASPVGGLLGGIDINTTGDGIIANDIAADTYFQFDYEGVEIDGLEFATPAADMGAFGNGVAVVPGEDAYELNTGPATGAFAGPDRILRVDTDGEALNPCVTDLGPGNFIVDTFLNDVALTDDPPVGLTGVLRYSTGNARGLLFRDPVECLPCAAPIEVTCDFAKGVVTLLWTEAEIYDEIDILRNGELIGEDLDGAEVSFTDSDITEFGETVYEVVATCTDSGGTNTATCTVWTVDPDVTALVWRAELPDGGIDSAQAAFDALDTNGVAAAIVDEIVGLNLDQFDIVFACMGTFPQNRVMTLAEGDFLNDFLNSDTGKAVYVEGGDHFFNADVDPDLDTSLHGNDGTDLVDDGPQLCEITTLFGSDSLLGLDLTGLGATYDCEGNFTDVITRQDIDGTAVVLTGDDDQGLMVFQDGAVTVGLDFRTLMSSVEFGGYEGDQAVFMDTIYCALTGGGGVCVGDGPMFIRGDADGNGTFFALLDALAILEFAFAGGDPLPCLKAADVDGNDVFFALLDALAVLEFAFSAADPPPTPFPDCGTDSESLSPSIDCEESTCP